MNHPKGMYVISSTAMLESFTYYIFAGLLVMYMIDVLHFSEPFSTYIFGIAYGSTYILQILGGYVCDKYLGNRKSLIFGISLIVLAQLIFTYDASLFYVSTGIQQHSALFFTYPEIIFLIGVVVMAVGVSFFKVNIASFVHLFYKEGSKLLDSAFSLFYFFINIGGFLAPLFINVYVGVHHPNLYQYGFLMGFLAMLIGLIMFILAKNKFFVSENGEPLGVTPRSKIQKVTENVAEKLTDVEISRLKVIFIILISVLVFQIFTQQIYTSIILFAENHVNNVLPVINVAVAPSFYLTLNPLFILFLSPIYIRIFDLLINKNKEPSSITKIGVGLLCLGVAYLVLFMAINSVSGDMKLNMMWVAIFNFFMVNSELLIMPITLSVISKLSPRKYTSSMYGIYYVTFSIASVIAGLCASAFPNRNSTMLFNVIPIANLSTYFILFAGLGLGIGVIWLLSKNKIIELSKGIL